MVDDLGGDPACWSHIFEADLEAGRVVDLDAASGPTGSGVAWSSPPGGDLNVNLVNLVAKASIAEHRNDEVDVLVVVLSGAGEVTIEHVTHRISTHQLLLIPAGTRRSTRASHTGLVYLSVHRARGGLTIKSVH